MPCAEIDSTLHSGPVLYPDILALIFDNFDPLDKLDQAACAAGALVCRSWSEPACAALWSRLDWPYPIYHIILPLPHVFQKLIRPDNGKRAWQDDAESSRLIVASYFDELEVVQTDLVSQNEVWKRFLEHASHVRKISQTWEAGEKESDFLRLLLERNGNATFLPGLRTLYWDEGQYTHGLLVALASPSLRVLTLSFDGADDIVLDTRLPPTLSQLAMKATSLHCLDIIAHPLLAAERAATALPEFGSLRCLKTSIERNSLMFPPNLTTLRCLVYNFAARCDNAYNASSLRKLMAQGDAPSILAFISSLVAPQIEQLYLVTPWTRDARGQNHTDVVKAIARSAFAHNLRDFAISMCKLCNMDSIRPLLSLSRLTQVEIRAADASYTDEDILVLARAWPHLEELVLNPSALFSQGPQARPTLACLSHFARHCPRLKRLEICVDYDQPFEIPDNAPTPSHPLETLGLSRARPVPEEGLSGASMTRRIASLICVLFPYAKRIDSAPRWFATRRLGSYYRNCDCVDRYT